jgi:CheY-like chemotaxis protein
MAIPTEPIGSIPRPLDLLEAIARKGSEDPSLDHERFRQGDASATRRPRGLGLAISATWWSSTAAPCTPTAPARGRGATFSIRLPLTVVHRRADDSARLHPAASGSAADFKRSDEAQGPDVVVSDIGMPDVDGYERLRRIRALRVEPSDLVATVASVVGRTGTAD